ncbi:MAG: MgtC/SapB family protein [Myxococcales bacterium]|nr:MgtC/SapB family protein [Myxococcales bacterium]MCB9580850.1 MgtC/SapB family protein [Polyangiaceae bacterium]
MHDLDALLSLGLALLLGLLIGFEREQSAPDDHEERRRTFVGGARTYPLVALAGALTMLLRPVVGVSLVVAGFLVLCAFLGISYWDEMRRRGDRGLTSEAAFMITYLLGALSSSPVFEPLERRAIVLAFVAVVVTVVLSVKPRLHALAERASKDDVFATLKFLIVAVVVLPLLPNEPFGPYGVLNPFKIGLMVVLIAGIDFVGYVAVRALGAGRGLGLTGIVGGLASSTAVTLSVSRRAKEDPSLRPSCTLAVVTASTVMVPRVLLEVSVVHRPLLSQLWIPLGAMTLGGAIAIGFLYKQSGDVAPKSQKLELSNPFELSSALKWGLIFTIVLFASRLAHELLGESGTYLAGLVAGASDVDAITLSMASLAKGGSVDPRVAVTTIMIGAAANTIVKGVMATVIGGWRYGRIVAAAFGGMMVSGAAGLAVVWLG